MIDARKIRMARTGLRLVALPAVVLGLSVLAGASVNTLLKPALAGRFDGQLQGQLMAVEAVEGRAAVRPAVLASPAASADAFDASIGQSSSPSSSVTAVALPAVDVAPTQPQVVAAALESDPQPVVAMVPVVAPQLPQPQARQAPVRQGNAGSARSQARNTTEHRYFNGRRIRPARTMTMVCTAYSPDEQSCGPHASGTTASGLSVWANGMKMVAADTRLLPFGTLVSIPGYYDGQPVPVLDRGGAIKGHRLDLLYPTHERALKWGRQRLQVTVWEYAD